MKNIFWVLVLVQVGVYQHVGTSVDKQHIQNFKQEADCHSAEATLNAQREPFDGKLYACIPVKEYRTGE